jgi:mannitol/fructose-specific phosphotransferase system IIA component (Ntr-type)
MLALISRKLMDEDFRSKIKKTEDAKTIVKLVSEIFKGGV